MYVLLYIPTATVPVTTLPQTPLPPSKCSGCLLILWLFWLKSDNCGSAEKSSLSTAEAVVTTAVVCGVCSFTAGLLLGVLLTQCHGHCHRKQKRGQTEIPPVYEALPWRRHLLPLNCTAMMLMDQYHNRHMYISVSH